MGLTVGILLLQYPVGTEPLLWGNYVLFLCDHVIIIVYVTFSNFSASHYLDAFLESEGFLRKRRGYCYRLRQSVLPLCYLLLNRWTNFNQIWCVSYSLEWGVQRQTFFGPAPWGPGEGSKGQIAFNFNYKVNFKDFYTKLCVCTHK